MRKVEPILFILILPFVFAFSCASTQKNEANSSKVSEIKWGKSFGMCRGYCFKEFRFSSDSVSTHVKSWQPEQYPAKDSSWINTDWSQLTKLINYTSFSQLEPRIGCPDCADGGSEWIEIKTTEGQSHKVLFEFGSAPASTEELLAYLRSKYN